MNKLITFLLIVLGSFLSYHSVQAESPMIYAPEFIKNIVVTTSNLPEGIEIVNQNHILNNNTEFAYLLNKKPIQSKNLFWRFLNVLELTEPKLAKKDFVKGIPKGYYIIGRISNDGYQKYFYGKPKNWLENVYRPSEKRELTTPLLFEKYNTTNYEDYSTRAMILYKGEIYQVQAMVHHLPNPIQINL